VFGNGWEKPLGLPNCGYDIGPSIPQFSDCGVDFQMFWLLVENVLVTSESTIVETFPVPVNLASRSSALRAGRIGTVD
jgi:hypothetical protein